jgi:hypothetical protein
MKLWWGIKIEEIEKIWKCGKENEGERK